MTTTEEAKKIDVNILDISGWQHNSKTKQTINYDLFAEHATKDNVVGIIIKGKEGSDYTNPHALEDYRSFKSLGFKVGFYNWLHPNLNIKLQTDYWADLPHDTDDIPMVTDIEMRKLIHDGIMTAPQYENAVLYALLKVKQNFGRSMAYLNYEEIRDWVSKRDLFNYPLMMALWEVGNRGIAYNWTAEKILHWYPWIMRSPFVDWALHQYSGYYNNPGALVTDWNFWYPGKKKEVNIDISRTSLHKFYYLTNQLHLLNDEPDTTPPPQPDPPTPGNEQELIQQGRMEVIDAFDSSVEDWRE